MSKDDDYFREQMKGVKPLKAGKERIQSTPSPVLRRKKISFEPDLAAEFPFSDHIRETVTAETKLSFSQSGLQRRVLQALRLGEIKQTAKLDLHGATINQARTALNHFLNHCLNQGHRCVLIIHGKGKPEAEAPLLKNHLNSWLQQYPAILAYCSAMSRDGGTGAVYVLLKKNKSYHSS